MLKFGDPDAAFKTAEHVLEGEVRMGGQEHFYLETQTCVVVPKMEDNEMEITSSTQHPTEMQVSLLPFLAFTVIVDNLVCNEI